MDQQRQLQEHIYRFYIQLMGSVEEDRLFSLTREA